MSMRNENNHNAHVNPTGLGPVQAYRLVYFAEIIGCIGKLALGKMRKVLEWAEFINLLHKVVSKRAPRKFITTVRPFSVKCK